ncbi:MAG: DUF4293 domain-containing protein [Bacteroidaceae bacterium]|nr:DUF4293 domain-containing protein [Bacteroidaceae bacterium]
MLQRIQSVYLGIAVALLLTTIFLPVGQFISADGATFIFTNLGVDLPNDAGRDLAPWGMFALLLFTAIISLATIFLYTNRILQIRMTLFSCILLVGYYLMFLFFTYILQEKYQASYSLSWALSLPLVALVLQYLALRAIGRDEAMVRAADRIR